MSNDLKSIKVEKLKNKIEKNEYSQNIIFLSLPIFVVTLLLFFEYVTGISTDNLINEFPTHFKGLFFVVTVAMFLTIILKSDYINNLQFQKQALSALKQAQIIITN